MAIVRFDAIRSIAGASVTTNYQDLGTALTHNWRMFKITNDTDGNMLFSLDGSTDNLFVPAGSFTLYDCATNAENINDTDNFLMQLGSQFQVKYSTAATSGNVWIEGVYSRGS